MKVEILGAYGGNAESYRLTSFLVNDRIALDAGCLTSALSFKRQCDIDHILISHSHGDHIGTLHFLIDNVFGYQPNPLMVHGSASVIQALKDHVFNDVIWPDFSKLPSQEKPSLIFKTFEPEQVLEFDNLRITPIPVNHIVPCTGFLVEEKGKSAFLYSADTTRTDRVWQVANQTPNLKAIIVDCSFPNEMESLALASGHLTPKLLAKELEKLHVDCDILVYHLKPSFEKRMIRELKALGIHRLKVNIQDEIFHF